MNNTLPERSLTDHGISVEATVQQALSRMMRLGEDWLAVLRQGRVVGLIQRSDLIRVAAGPRGLSRRISAMVRDVASDCVWLAH